MKRFAIVTLLTWSSAVAAQQPKNPAVVASNDFACDLYKKLAEKDQSKSVLFSPYSISVALAMTLEGARGDTAREMGEVLRLAKLLRQDAATHPWLTLPYCQGFSDLN